MTSPQPIAPGRRILALDPGEARIGVAVSDELGAFAHPRPAIPARDLPAAVAAIADLVMREGIAEVIVGLPLTLSGERGAQALAVEPLLRELRAKLPIPVTTADERLTTAQAARQAPRAARRRDGSLDSLAAALLLQSILDARRGRP
ncbi:Holliday junction resolvase RuvX [Tepidiforma sp.]|uniref:Holliday junction resolvase RuvX n=1 Tax=Tepidiforma sp. TaxID=2682230 RepID=UPI002ADD84BB|nr:Holliday junction resolvase RuvX [Tepidiforma sp.]